MPGSIGFSGKIPSKGDFISSNLPGNFLRPWDNWLRLALAHCGERLGGQLRTVFLSSPVWRFILAEGCCGPQAWAGVIASSIDQVGRLYPLTLAVQLDSRGSELALMTGWTTGFERLIDIALAMLREGGMLERADAALQQLVDQLPPVAGFALPPSIPSGDATALALGDSLSVASIPEGPQFTKACANAAMRAGAQLSVMWQLDWGAASLAVIGCGLPDTARSATIWELTATLR